jgi:hypothetical protein
MKGAMYYLQKSSGMEPSTVFKVSRNHVEGHYGQIGAGYSFDSSLQEAYLERIVDY